MELFLTSLASALGGALITALVFVLAFTNKITMISANLATVSDRLDKHVSLPVTPCAFHTQVESDLAVLKSKAK
jgi:hypothetical protein